MINALTVAGAIVCILIATPALAQRMTLRGDPVEGRIIYHSAAVGANGLSCYDCHSNESRWPWYGYVAPLSWLVAYDIDEAREHLNFSTWNRYDDDEQIDLIEEAWEQVEAGEMPLFFYLPLHPDARLSPEDRAQLERWADEAG